MDTVAEVAPRRRRVRCPFCRTILIEPAGSPVFECSICSNLLRAKGTPADFQGQSWQSPLEANRSHGQEQLDNHETNAQISMNGNISHQEQRSVPVRNEIVSVLENGMAQEVQLHSDVRNGSTSVGNLDTTSDYASKKSTAIGEEGMVMVMQEPLDNVNEEGTSASKTSESQKAQVLMDHTRIQGMLSNEDGKAVLQSPLEDAQNCSTASSSTEEDVIVGECEGMRKSYKECNPLTDGNDRIFESELPRDNDCKKIIAIGKEGMGIEMQQHLDYVSEAGNSASKSGESQEAHALMDHINIQGISSNGDGRAVLQSPLEDAQNCSMVSSSKGEDMFRESEGMEGKNYKECHTLADVNDRTFQSEIIRDSDCKKSTVLGEEDMAMEMQQPLDYVSEDGTSASETGESQEALVLMDHIITQGISSNGDDKAVLQSPLEDEQNCGLSSASKGEDVFVGESEFMEGKNYKECESLADGNDRIFESEIVRDDCKKSTAIGEEGMAMEMQQPLDYMSEEGSSASKGVEAQILMDHINIQGISRDGKAVSQSQNYKECDILADMNDRIFQSEISRDNDCKKSSALGEEGMDMEMQQSLDYRSERGSSASKRDESHEAQELMDHISIQGISSNGDSKAVLQSPLEDAHNWTMASSSKEEDVGDCKRLEGKNYKECDTLADGNDQIFESAIIRDNDCMKNTIGEEGMAMEMQQPLDYLREEGTSAGQSGESQETQVLMDHIHIQGISSNGDDKAVLQSPLEDAQNCSIASSSKEDVFVSECEGMEGKNYRKCDTSTDGNDRIFESEIVRDNACKESTAIGEEGMAMEMQQRLDYVNEGGSSASKTGESQEAQLLIDHINIQGISSNGDGKAVLHSPLEGAQNCSMASSSKEEDASDGGSEGMQGKKYKECDTLADGNDRIFVSEIIRNNACKKIFAIGEERIAMEMQQPLDYVSEEGSSASKSGESQEALVLMDHINIQGISSSGDGKAVLKIPLEDAQNCMASSSKEGHVFVGESEGMEGKNHKECDTSANGNDRILEPEIIRDNDWKKNTAIGKEGMAMEMQQPLDYASEEGTSASKNSEAQEAQVLMDHANTQGLSSNGDDKAALQSPMLDSHNCSMSSASEEENVLIGESQGVEGKNHKEHDTLANGSDRAFESEIIRDNEWELSFKYISSTVELAHQTAHRRKPFRLSKMSSEASVHESEVSDKPLYARSLASSSDENSDESGYSSVSVSASDDGSDSDFDFPAPLAENMLPEKLTDTFVQQKIPSPSDVPATPHQLEWQDVYYDNEEYTFQNSNGAIVSSVGVVGNVASDVPTVAEQGDQVEIAEGVSHTREEKLMKRETVLRGHDDTAATVSESLHAQRENGCSGLGVLANTVGFVASEGGDENVVLNDTPGTEEDYNGYHSMFNERKPSLSNNLWDEGLSSGARHPLKPKARCTLKEGNLNTNTLSLGRESSASSLPGGREEETCLAVQESSQFIKSVANVSPKDSVATSSSSGYEANAGANHSKIASQMISMQKIGGKSSDSLHLQHDMLMPVANNQRQRAAPSSDLVTKRNVANVYLAQNKELESAGLQPSLVTEQGNLSSGGAFNMFETRLHHNRNYSSEETQVHNREGVPSMFDPRLHHQRNYSSEATQMHNVAGEFSSKHTSQVQQSIYNEGLDISRAARPLKGSSKTRQRHVQADSELADGQGPLLQKQNRQPDSDIMEQTMTHSGPVNDVRGFSPASSQSCGFNNYYDGSDVFARGVPSANMAYSYQAPPHPLMLSVAMQGHACSHFGCHFVAPVCMACVHHHQHSHVPQPLPPCGFCFNQSLSMAHQQGHPELRNYSQIHQVWAPDQGVPAVPCPPTWFSSQTAHMHDTAMLAAKPLVSSARRPNHYPPLPRGSTAPYVICKGCNEILQVPTDHCLSDGVDQKLRCGACRKVSKFSVSKGIQETCNVGLRSSALESSRGASTSISPLVQDANKESRQLPVSNTIQSMESSYHQGVASGMYPKYQQGAIINSQHQTASGVVPAGVSRRLHHNSEDEIIYQTQSRQGEADCKITAAITDHSSQDEFFFRSLSRQCEFDSSRDWFKASSSAIGAVNCSDERLVVGNDMSLQASVDEKEEGLDFGAPRMSDGESLDARSPESRKKPPESKRRFQLVEQNRYRKASFEEGEASWMNELKQSNTAQAKMPSTSLIALLNQESTKFEINMEQRVSFEESRSALWSSATNSPMYDAGTDQGSNARDEGIDRPCNLTAQQFVKKGPRYIAGMLRRSLRDFRR